MNVNVPLPMPVPFNPPMISGVGLVMSPPLPGGGGAVSPFGPGLVVSLVLACLFPLLACLFFVFARSYILISLFLGGEGAHDVFVT